MSNLGDSNNSADKVNLRMAAPISLCKNHRDSFKLIRFKSEKRQNYSCSVSGCDNSGFAYPEPKDLPKELAALTR